MTTAFATTLHDPEALLAAPIEAAASALAATFSDVAVSLTESTHPGVERIMTEQLGANDVEWPLLAEQLGHAVGYVAANGLKYRTIEEFAAPADSNDDDPLHWIRRIEMSAEHAKAMRPYLSIC